MNKIDSFVKKKMAKKEMSYNESMTEIEAILAEIDSNNLDLDSLSEKVKRATELISSCKTKLTNADQEIEKLLKKME